MDQLNLKGSKIRNNNFTPAVRGVGVYDKGNSYMANNSASFESAMDDVVSGPNLLSYLYYDGASNLPNGDDFDIFWSYGLNNDDYLLVMERDGNTHFDVTPLDSMGNPISNAKRIKFGQTNGTNSPNGNSKYDWNIGYRPGNVNQPMYITAIDVELFGTTKSIHGVRIDNNGNADVKFFGASDDPFENNEITRVIGSLCGTVYADDNLNAYVDGTGIDSVNGSPLYVSLLNATGSIVGTTSPDQNGEFAFLDLDTGNYTALLHNTSGGASASSPPSGWYFRGEILGNITGHDGNKDGYLNSIIIGDTLVSYANFSVFSTPLSVKWLTITAKQSSGTSTIIEWSTSSEEGSEYFVVERSTDGEVFEAIGELTAVGYSSSIANYTFIDLGAEDDKYFYRVKLININKTTDYSPLTSSYKKSQTTNELIFSVFPNPASSQISIVLADTRESSYTVEILDHLGSSVARQEITGNQLSINTSNLRSGVYTIAIQSRTQMSTKRLLVSH